MSSKRDEKTGALNWGPYPAGFFEGTDISRPDQVIGPAGFDVGAWAEARRRKNGGVRPEMDGVTIIRPGKKGTRIADSRSRKVAGLLGRLGLKDAAARVLESGKSGTAEDRSSVIGALKKKFGGTNFYKAYTDQSDRVQTLRTDMDNVMTWEKQKAEDAKRAAEARAAIRRAEGVPPTGGQPAAGGNPSVPAEVGGGRPQGYWDGWKPTSASRGKVGDAPHYYSRDDSWMYNVSNTRGGVDAIRDRIERGNWSVTSRGRLARAEQRAADAMMRREEHRLNKLADQIDALNGLAEMGYDVTDQT